MNIDKNSPKNNFATALAAPIIDAALGRGDIRLFSESGSQPPLTEAAYRAAEIEAMRRGTALAPWLLQIDAGGKTPTQQRLKKLGPVISEADYVVICECEPDFLTVVFVIGEIDDNGNTVIVGNTGASLLDWVNECGHRNNETWGDRLVSIVTEKKMKALQVYMHEHGAEALYGVLQADRP